MVYYTRDSYVASPIGNLIEEHIKSEDKDSIKMLLGLKSFNDLYEEDFHIDHEQASALARFTGISYDGLMKADRIFREALAKVRGTI